MLPYRITFLLFLVAILAGPTGAVAETQRDLILILDGSGSMWGRVEERPKIAVAKEVLGQVVDKLGETDRVGLIAYGHRRKGDCDDVEALVPLGPLQRDRLKDRIQALSPKGKTPITRSVGQAVDTLRTSEQPATVVLVSDGLETCGGDPCQAVRAARESGVELVMHVVGFGLAEDETGQLQCMAEAGGGRYWSAQGAGELAAALEQAVAAEPPPPPQPTLTVTVTESGELTEAEVEVLEAGTGRRVDRVRVHPRERDNPKTLELPPGNYDLRVTARKISGTPTQVLAGLTLEEGDELSRSVDFGAGELSIEATGNGELIQADVEVVEAGTGRRVERMRVQARERDNPKTVSLPPGDYDVRITARRIAGKPVKTLTGLSLSSGSELARSVDFSSGDLTVTVMVDGMLLQADVEVYRADTEDRVDRVRVQARQQDNPKTLTLPPGVYDLHVIARSLEGRPVRRLEDVSLEAGTEVKKVIDFADEG